jgi:peptidoglycan/LPS O-acetylase OafA/YrhL
MFFVEGVFIKLKQHRDYRIGIILLTAICTLVLSYFESKYLFSYNGGGVGIKPTSFLFSFVMVLLLFSYKCDSLISNLGWFYKAIIKIGDMSFGVYLIHCYIIIACGNLIPQWNSTFWAVKWSIVIILSLAIVIGGRQLLPRFAKYIGFR